MIKRLLGAVGCILLLVLPTGCGGWKTIRTEDRVLKLAVRSDPANSAYYVNEQQRGSTPAEARIRYQTRTKTKKGSSLVWGILSLVGAVGATGGAIGSGISIKEEVPMGLAVGYLAAGALAGYISGIYLLASKGASSRYLHESDPINVGIKLPGRKRAAVRLHYNPNNGIYRQKKVLFYDALKLSRDCALRIETVPTSMQVYTQKGRGLSKALGQTPLEIPCRVMRVSPWVNIVKGDGKLKYKLSYQLSFNRNISLTRALKRTKKRHQQLLKLVFSNGAQYEKRSLRINVLKMWSKKALGARILLSKLTGAPAAPVAVRQPTPVPRRWRGERHIVAVFNIEDKGARLTRQMLDRLSEYLAMKLAASGRYQVVPRDQLKLRLVEQKAKSYKKCYDQSCQIEIGREMAAQRSLSTVVMKLGTKCMVTAVLYDLKKATSVHGASTTGQCHEDGIVASIKQVVRELTTK